MQRDTVPDRFEGITDGKSSDVAQGGNLHKTKLIGDTHGDR